MLLSLALLACATAVPTDTGEDVIRAMHDRYAGEWYENLTFIQRTTFMDSQTQQVDSVQIWYESLVLGGNLRIDIAPLDAGNGIVFRNDSLYAIRQGEVALARPLLHPLLILGFDVYSNPVEETVSRLNQIGFDLDRMYESEWQGREVWVVGAESAEDNSNQFWIDKERLVFVRMLQYSPSGAVSEIQFNDYEPLDGGWISPEVVFMVNGRTRMVEEYGNYRTDVELPPELFSVDERTRLPWVKN